MTRRMFGSYAWRASRCRGGLGHLASGCEPLFGCVRPLCMGKLEYGQGRGGKWFRSGWRPGAKANAKP